MAIDRGSERTGGVVGTAGGPAAPTHPPRLDRGEALRQTVHIAAGLMALLIRWWGIPGTIALATAAVAVNLWLLPRFASALLRRTVSGGRDLGVVSYPLAVLLLALLFGRHPEVVAAAWGVLAFGDGTATLVGRALGRRRLPWNGTKSWLGSLAYWLFGTLAAGLLLLWTTPGVGEAPFVWAVCAAVVLGSALLESLPLGLEDNLFVPLPTALGLLLLLGTQGAWGVALTTAGERLLPALGLNIAFGAVAYGLRGIDRGGLFCGVIVGTVIYLAMGPSGYGVLVAFYALGTTATQLGYGRKRCSGMAERRGARRSARNVLANAGVATVCAVLALTGPDGGLFGAAFVAALAAATGDTLASEIGQLAAGRTRLVTTLAMVEPGTEGGVSLVGSLAGVGGACGVAVLAGWWGLCGVSELPIIGPRRGRGGLRRQPSGSDSGAAGTAGQRGGQLRRHLERRSDRLLAAAAVRGLNHRLTEHQ